MSLLDDPLPSHWQYYADRAREAHLGYTDDFGQGREEQLHETLKFIAIGEPFTGQRQGSLDRIPHNRGKKHRRLRLYTFNRAACYYFDDPHTELLDRVHESLSPSEWEVECRLAEGETYADIAGITGVSPDTLKMQASRWRARVRQRIAV